MPKCFLGFALFYILYFYIFFDGTTKGRVFFFIIILN